MTRQHAVIASRLVVTAIRQRAELLRGRPEERARALRAIETVRRIAKERRVESMAAVQLIRRLDRVRGGIPHAVDAPRLKSGNPGGAWTTEATSRAFESIRP